MTRPPTPADAASRRPPAPRAPSRRRRLAVRLVALAGSLLLFLLTLEVVLRLGAPWVAPALGEVGNYVYSHYGRNPGDIYFRDRELRSVFMVPDFATTNYWNGYFWHHATDRWGFRNPPGTPTDVLVVGDSFVYGHGVEEADTLTAVLRREHGVGAYDMGRQGSCLYQEYLLLRLYLDTFRPRQVVLMVFVNDFDDLEVYRTAAEIAERPEVSQYDYRSAAQRIWNEGRHVRRAAWRWPLRSQAIRLLVAAWRKAGLPRHLLTALPAAPALAETPASAAAAGAAPQRPAGVGRPASYLVPVLHVRRFEPLLAYYDAVLADLARRTAAVGAGLSVVFIDNPQLHGYWEDRAQRRVDRRLRRLCRAHGIRYRTLRPVLLGCDACFLPVDGHFSPEGHRRVADFLAAELLTPADLDRPAADRPSEDSEPADR